MKTTYYLKENVGGEFLLVVEDDGVVKYAAQFPHTWNVGDLLAELMDGASGQWMDDEQFGNEVDDFSELSENWADCAVIADQDGVYAERAGKNGKYVLQYAKLAHDWERVIDECESEADIIELFDTFSCTDAFATIEKNGEKAFDYIVPVMCKLFAAREDEDFEGLVDKISDIGIKLFVFQWAGIRYEKDGEDDEVEECNAAKASRMVLTVEGWRASLKSLRVAETIARALPVDGYVGGKADYESDDNYIWYTWTLQK